MHVAAFFPASLALVARSAATPAQPFQPTHDAAQTNANHIFNALHAAGRQWGSSIHHNGLGFIPAHVPKGTLLHHGTHTKDTPDVFEWLAFEVEHAENFAFSRLTRKIPDDPDDGNDGVRTGQGAQQQQQQTPLHQQRRLNAVTYPPLMGEKGRGYLHTYQATQDLNLLYLDGMAAAKSEFGTLDSQDYVLRGLAEEGGYFDDWRRAEELCAIIEPWGYQGIIRMEFGFEIIYCDFHDGNLALMSQTRTLVGEDKLTEHDSWLYHAMRGASHRYDGIGANRLQLDFSSMLSGFFYPMNVSSNIPGRPDLLRLGTATREELSELKDAVGRIGSQPRRYTVDWQAITDQVITRFADRFSMLGTEDGITDEMFMDDLEGMVLTYFDAPPLPEDDKLRLGENDDEDIQRRRLEAVERCSRHFLLPALLFEAEFSEQDDLIYTAVLHVTRRICETTQQAWWKLVLSQTPNENVDHAEKQKGYQVPPQARSEAVREARAMIRELMKDLDWATWKMKRRCAPNAFLFVAMWPFGNEKDHWDPDCRSVEELMDVRKSIGYWDLRLGNRSTTG
ncbi:hypothetical protein LIA77_10973 [Sarocladium implicatum]|nr:hypothetical protein LIA77_10973 [Sarocladium implicatum]